MPVGQDKKDAKEKNGSKHEPVETGCCTYLGLALVLHVQANGLCGWNIALQWNSQLVWLEIRNGAVSIMGCCSQEAPTGRPRQVSDMLQVHCSEHCHRHRTFCIAQSYTAPLDMPFSVHALGL